MLPSSLTFSQINPVLLSLIVPSPLSAWLRAGPVWSSPPWLVPGQGITAPPPFQHVVCPVAGRQDEPRTARMRSVGSPLFVEFWFPSPKPTNHAPNGVGT